MLAVDLPSETKVYMLLMLNKLVDGGSTFGATVVSNVRNKLSKLGVSEE